MDEQILWQSQALNRLSEQFERDATCRAMVISGSLADDGVAADMWSDIDVKLVLADEAVARYFPSVEWLCDFGKVIGVERHAGPVTKTLRICLEGYQRYDFVFIPESALDDDGVWQLDLFGLPCKVLWSRLPHLEAQINAHAKKAVWQDISAEELTGLIEQFWFKAAVAIGKVARNDLLIGLHLALDLARDCLVLQMIRRDREKGTNVHRAGGWGNQLASRLTYTGGSDGGTASAILDLVQQSGGLCDELAAKMLPAYEARSALLLPSIIAAKHVHSSQGQACG